MKRYYFILLGLLIPVAAFASQSYLIEFTTDGEEVSLSNAFIPPDDYARAIESEFYIYEIVILDENYETLKNYYAPSYTGISETVQKGKLTVEDISEIKDKITVIVDMPENAKYLQIIKDDTIIYEESISEITQKALLNTILNESIDVAQCVSVYGNKGKDKFNVVFLSDKIEMNDFVVNYVYKGIEDFFNTEPFRTNYKKINFMYVNKPYDLNCTSGLFPALCNIFSAEMVASKCKNVDQIVVYSDRVSGGMSPWHSKIAFMDSPYFTVHEVSHGYFGLGDEYLYDFNIYFPFSFYNCALKKSSSSGKPCPAWSWASDFPEVGCYKGCGFKNLYRPTKDSCIMKSISSGHYCPVCYKKVNKMLSKFK